MYPDFQVQLFGQFRLLSHNEPVSLLHQPRLQSLLAYLVLHRDLPQTRRHLSFVFWPDSSEAQALANLRKALHDLRRVLPHMNRLLQIHPRYLQWHKEATVSLDVAIFEGLLEQATAETRFLPKLRFLEQAVALYTGALLPECYDDWVLSARERLRQRYLQALEQLISLEESRREYSLAATYAQRLLSVDPLHEFAYRTLMRLYTQKGDRARALRVYHTCATVLQQQLGIAPGPETQAAYRRLLNMEVGAATQPASGAPIHRGELPLVGRQREWETLQRVWRAAAQGQPQVVLIAGEAGIGKTRLAEELLQWAEDQGYATATARCYAAEGRLAYVPVVEWLRTEPIQKQLLQMESIWLTEIARLLPELLTARPDVTPPQPLPDGARHHRFREALAHAIRLLDEPLLLMVDDLQWCDQNTLEWLHYLLRFAAQARLLVLGTVRSEEVQADHPLVTLTTNLSQNGTLIEVELARLDAGETAILAAHAAGYELTQEQAASLYRETEGYPLFVVEMIRSGPANTQASLSDLSELWDVKTGLPPKVQTIIQARLHQLSTHARELAGLAATAGRAFTVEVLAQAGDANEDALVQGLDELWQRRIIREQGEDAYDFSHDKIREAAYTGLSSARRRLLHRRVAQALERVYAANLDRVNGQIAAHYEGAGLLQPAVRYYQQAAEGARRVYANQEAKILYSRAIEVFQRIDPTPDEAQLLPIYEGRALAYRSLGQYAEAIADLHRMRQLARSAGNLQQEGESLCHLAYTHWLTFAYDHMPLVEQYAQEAIEGFAQFGENTELDGQTGVAAPVGELSILARGFTMLGAVDQVQRNMAEAGRKFEKALEIGRRVGDTVGLVQTFHFLCLQTTIQSYSQASVQYAQEGIAVARAVQDDFSELLMLAFLCQGYWNTGNYTQSLTLAYKTLAQAKALENTFMQGRLLNTLGWFHHELGDFSSALAFNQESVEVGRAAVEITALVNLGYDYLALGQPAQALAHFEPTFERVQREGRDTHKWRWEMKLWIGLAEHALRTGDYVKALRAVDAGLEEALATTSQKYVAKGRALRGKILLGMGNTAAAGEELQRAFALAQQIHSPSLLFPLAYELGQWYEMMGKPREAAALYGKAKAVTEQMAAAVEDEVLAATFLQSKLVQAIWESLARTA